MRRPSRGPFAVALVAACAWLSLGNTASAQQDHSEHQAPGSHAGDQGKVRQGGMKTVRQNASEMTRAERTRFKRAWSWAVRRGYFDEFNAQHYDHLRNRQHGADVQAGVPTHVMPGHAASWGYRLLPWHRAFILEAERMLNGALADRRRAEGKRRPADFKPIFMPYWDAANEQRLPRWVREFKPKGGRATVPVGVPRGHAAYGKPVGTLYRIEFNRWPGRHPMFDKLPPADQIVRILEQPTWLDFYNRLDVVPEVIDANVPALLAAVETLNRKIPNDPDFQRVKTVADPNAPQDPQSQLAVFNSFLALGYKAAKERAEDQPDMEYFKAVKAMYDAVRFPPHLVLHFWAGGLDPRNPDLRGTVTYFNELVVDPVFWMLHTELDRYWYTWSRSHSGRPELTGEDALFQPITPLEGEWYGGGRAYGLGYLSDLSRLPYRYDSVFSPR